MRHEASTGIIPVHFLQTPETMASMLPAAAGWIATMLEFRGMLMDDLVLLDVSDF
jgi:hypothetical protein